MSADQGFFRRRNWEALLLLLASAVFVVGMAAVSLARGLPFQGARITFPLVMVGLWYAVHIALRLLRPRADEMLVPLVALLSGLGLIFVETLAPGIVARERVNLIIAIAGFAGIVFGLRDVRWLSLHKYTAAALAIVLLVLTMLLGKTIGHAQLSLRLGGIGFQPTEVVKILVVIFLAAYLAEKRELFTIAAGRWGLISGLDLRYAGPVAVMWLLSLLLIVKQQDLGAALLLYGIFLAMIYLATGRWAYVAVGLALFAAGALMSYLTVDRVQDRIAIWLDPWSRAEGTGFQIVSGLSALKFGGVWGAGLGGGLAHRIPAAHTDFAFTGVAEQLGLVGAVALLVLYLLLIMRAFNVALRTPDEFGALAAAGLAVVWSLQSLVIIAGVIRLAPLTGIALPFVSYGGTSLVCNFAMAGLLLAISDQGERERLAEVSDGP